MTAIGASASTVSPDVELRRTLVIVGGIVCFETVLYSILGPLLPRLADHFALSKTAAGTLVAMYAAGAFLGSLPSGLAAARFGAKATALGAQAGNQWHYVALVYYPTVAAFIDMMTSPDYEKLSDPHRRNGCAEHVIIATSEAYSKFKAG